MQAGANIELSQGAAALECRSITKLFGGVQALADVSVTLRAGEILCLVGDNGAGKSTLTKVLTGQLQPEIGADPDQRERGSRPDAASSPRTWNLGGATDPGPL